MLRPVRPSEITRVLIVASGALALAGCNADPGKEATPTTIEVAYTERFGECLRDTPFAPSNIGNIEYEPLTRTAFIESRSEPDLVDLGFSVGDDSTLLPLDLYTGGYLEVRDCEW